MTKILNEIHYLFIPLFLINIILSLYYIINKLNNTNETTVKRNRIGLIVLFSSIPLVIACLFLGNYLYVKNDEKKIKDTAVNIAYEIREKYKLELDNLTNYEFSNEWRKNADVIITLSTNAVFSKNTMNIIVEDEIDGRNYYLAYNHRTAYKEINKKDFVKSFDTKEMEYIEKVFKENYDEEFFNLLERKYSFEDKRYRLFIPYEHDGKRIILLFSNLHSWEI
jgi:hypothetical protein